ncbi:MAG: hypothetical protein ACPGVU_02645 [Limisphaerales bacterium]
MKVFQLLLSIPCLLPAVLGAAEPLRIGNEPQLFIDDHVIERMVGLERTLHQPEDILNNPVIVSEHPWEHRRIPFGSVLWFPEEQKFKCWYLAMNIYDSRPGFRGYRMEHHIPINEAAYICYAESKDGINWTKPKLRLHEFRGSNTNNILLASPGTHFDSLSVMHLPQLKEWPYRMMVFIGRWPYRDDLVKKKWGDPPPFGITQHGHYAFGSKDGIHWQVLNDNKPVLRASDRSMFWWDPKKQIFAGAAKRSHNGKRAQAYAWSRDMLKWTVTPDWIHKCDERDHPGDEGEAAYGFPYGSQWVGFAEMRRVRPGQPTKINWELLSSRNGRKWERPRREMFFADAGTNTWRYEVFKVFANPPVERDGRLLIYYGGKIGTVPVETGMEPFQALCLATLRKDGFVSLDAGSKGGELMTKPFVFRGDRLLLNARGNLRVGIQDQAGAIISGFGLEDCREISGDEIQHPVRWAKPISSLSGSKIRLRIAMREASLFALRFSQSQAN